MNKGDGWAILGLINIMVGSGLLVLPVISMPLSPWIFTLAVWVMGFLTYYTAYILADHQGRMKSTRAAISEHFN